ncbi:MAG: MFS transporter [Alphaproteobacteria bacterium]
MLDAIKRHKTPTTILVAGCISMMLAFGFRNSFGVFIAPLSSELGWGRELLGLSLAIQNLMWGVSQPIAGYLADRYGSGRVIAVSALIYAIGLFGSSLIFSASSAHIFAGLLIGIGLGGTSNAIILSVVARSAPVERRSLTLGIATAAASGGQLILVPFAAYFLKAYSVQGCLVLFAMLAFIILMVSPFLSGKPSAPQKNEAKQTIGEALKEAFTHWSYLFLLAGFFVCGFHVTFIGLHLPGFLIQRGFSVSIGAWAIALIGAGNIIGAISAGYLGSFISKSYLLSSIYISRAVVILLFIYMPMSTFTIIAFALIMGLLWLSTVPLTSGLVGQIFGMRYMATLFGLVFLYHQLGAFLGAWLGGYYFDKTGSYDAVWLMSIALGVFAAAIHWPIKDQPVERLTAVG